MKQLGPFNNRAEAQIVQGLLRHHGIESGVSADDMGGLRPHMALTLGVKLWVEDEDYERACQLIEEYQQQANEDDSEPDPDSAPEDE